MCLDSRIRKRMMSSLWNSLLKKARKIIFIRFRHLRLNLRKFWKIKLDVSLNMMSFKELWITTPTSSKTSFKPKGKTSPWQKKSTFILCKLSNSILKNLQTTLTSQLPNVNTLSRRKRYPQVPSLEESSMKLEPISLRLTTPESDKINSLWTTIDFSRLTLLKSLKFQTLRNENLPKPLEERRISLMSQLLRSQVLLQRQKS